MAYLGNGIYDLIDVIKASGNPQINYEGLYQDQMPNVITFNPLKAMTPGYTFSNLLPRYFDKNPDMASPSGKFYDDLKLRSDFKRVNQGLPLFNRYYDPNRVGRFEGFNPRVGTTTPFQPYESPTFLAKQNVDPYFKGTGIENTTVANEFPQDDDYESIQPLPDDQVKKPGISKLFEFLQNLPTPINLIRGGLESLRGFNDRIQGSDFGQSKTLVEYFKRKRNRRQAREARKNFPEVYASADKQGFTNEKGGFSTTSADKAGTSLGSGQFSPSRSTGRSGY